MEVSAAATTANGPAGQVASARPGRRRRPARTPSQISTKSLPPYMLEPGDQELVIYRCAYLRTCSTRILLTSSISQRTVEDGG
jgi:hypothetical protein